MEKEYIIILKNAKDLDQFYEDMESRYGDDEIPSRIVECAARRSMSRSTHYYLTDEEAEQVRRDSRVLDVTRTIEDLGVKPRLLNTTINPQQNWNYYYPPISGDSKNYSGWNKLEWYNDPWTQFPGSTNPDLAGNRGTTYGSTTWINWALLRCTKRAQVADWGYGGTPEVFDSVTLGVQGQHVDVVIIDGVTDPTHVEFTTNSDGTGVSRRKYYNWFQHNQAVRGVAITDFPDYDVTFPYYRDSSNDHGTHTASIVAGNTCGWARKASIYNLPFARYGSEGIYDYDNGNSSGYEYDVINYVREFHRTKPINPITGRKNPTIVNMSYGYGPSSGLVDMDASTYIWFKGTKYTRPGDSWIWVGGKLDLTARFKFGLIDGTYSEKSDGTGISENYVYYHTRIPTIDQDIIDAISEGIIFCAAAGNSYHYIDVPGGAHYNNRLSNGSNQTTFSNDQYFHRGPTPGAAPGVIMVSAVDSYKVDRKASFSCAGPRTDIFAPGVGITGAGNGAYSYSDKESQVDMRTAQLDNSGNFVPKAPYTRIHYRTRAPGTSFASPQVTGVIASILEAYPTLNQAQAKTKMLEMATSNQLLNQSPAFNPDYSNTHFGRTNTTTYGAPNKYLGYVSPTVSLGISAQQKFPKFNNGTRSTDGQTWPRTKFYRQS